MLNYIKNYYTLSTSARGRSASRAEYFTGLGLALLGALVTRLFPVSQDNSVLSVAVLGARALITVLLIYPIFALSVRRLHDVGLSGWFLLIAFLATWIIPFGALSFLILGALPTKTDGNKMLDVQAKTAPSLEDNPLIGFKLSRVFKILLMVISIPVLLILVLSLLG